MGGKESKQFPISYDEASKRGEVYFLGLTSTFGAEFEDLVHHIQGVFFHWASPKMLEYPNWASQKKFKYPNWASP